MIIRTLGKSGLFAGVVLSLIVSSLFYFFLEARKNPPPPETKKAVIPVHAPQKLEPPRFSEAIPPGMRAVGLSVDEISGTSRELKEGDIVDILSSSPTKSMVGDSKRMLKHGGLSRVIVKNVSILSFSTDAGGQSKRWPVTLLMTLQQACVLKAAGHDPITVRLVASNPTESKRAVSDFKNNELPAFTALDGVTYLMKSDANRLTRRIKPGMRALGIICNEVSFFKHLNPGDRVDIFYRSHTARFRHAEENDPGKRVFRTRDARTMITTVLQNVEVIATSDDMGWRSSSYSETTETDLIVVQATPQDAEKLIFMTAFVKSAIMKPPIYIVRRHSADKEKLPIRMTEAVQAMGQRIEYTRVNKIKGMQTEVHPFYVKQKSIANKGLKAN